MKPAFFILFIIALITAPFAAHAAPATKIEVSRAGDVEMTCEQLWKEAFLMRSMIQQTRETQHDSKMQSRGIGVVGTAASYLVGTVTGGLSIAAAGFFASNEAQDRSEDAELIQETAQQRRALIAGIFSAKKCEGPIEDAMHDEDPAPQKPVPTTALRVAEITPESGKSVSTEKAGPPTSFLPSYND